MCLLCVEFNKGNMTIEEAGSAVREMILTLEISNIESVKQLEHLMELEEKINKNKESK